MDMIERVARRLCHMGTNFPKPEQTLAWVDQKWRRFEPEARVAIEEMRDPTEDMINAGCHHELLGDMAGRYNAMIDAALSRP